MAHYDRFERRKAHVNRQAMGGGGSTALATSPAALTTTSSTSTSSIPTTTSTSFLLSLPLGTTTSSTISTTSTVRLLLLYPRSNFILLQTSKTSVAAPATTVSTAHVTPALSRLPTLAQTPAMSVPELSSGLLWDRRYKKRKEEDEIFSASQFRRSAVLLDDEMDQPMGGAPYMNRGPNGGHSGGGSQYGNSGGGSGYATHEQQPASFAHPQYAGYAPQPPQPAFGPGEVMGHNVYSEQDIRAAPFDGDPFSPARDPYLTRQPSSASGMYHPDQQYDQQQFPPVPQHAQDPFNSPHASVPQHASYNSAAPQLDMNFEQPQQQYADVNRVTSMGSESARAHAGFSEHSRPHEVPIPASPMLPHDAASGAKRPDTVYDPEDAYGGM
ncbi:hypothetical protein BDZ89DRAFT_1067005 [Hymenopellis radicata]|nr:hypothetical protein BDZ89DRAFT_1067005 [Hymenopellis radicata]